MDSQHHSRVKAVQCEVTLQGLSTAKKVQDTTVSRKATTSVFLDLERVIHFDFLPHGVNINAQ
jgi:hypothetical protein